MPTTTIVTVKEPERLAEGIDEWHEISGTLGGTESERVLQRTGEANAPMLLFVFDDNGTGRELEYGDVEVAVDRAPATFGIALLSLNGTKIEISHTRRHAEHRQQTSFGQRMCKAVTSVTGE